METYFINTLGRLCYPKPHQGPLVNIQRDRRDPREMSETRLCFRVAGTHILKAKEVCFQSFKKNLKR